MPWPMFHRVERQAQHMSEMMERLDVDAGAAVRCQQGSAFAQARANCLRCGSTRECCRWLDGEGDAPHPVTFCPNAPFFESCRRH